MSKKDIGKILTTGSTKQRLLLCFENLAIINSGKPPLLTDSDFNQLSNSFKKPNEIKLWNKWVRLNSKISMALMNLQGLKFEVLMHYSNLRGYILVWDTLQETEVLTNHILHEIKDQKERKKIASIGGKIGRFLFSEIQIDTEGYLDINIDADSETYEDENGKLIGYKDKPIKTKKHSLWYVMNNVKKEAIVSATRYISWSKAIEDFMEEEGFNIKHYKDMLKSMDQAVYTPIISWTKYRSDEESFIPNIPSKRVDKLKGKFAITPNIFPIEPDQEIYNYFKKEFLADE